MKKILITLLASTALLFSCQQYDDSALNERLDSVEQKLTKLESKVNDQAESLSKLINATYIQSVEKTEGGFKVVFSDNTEAFVSNGQNGKDGKDGNDGKNGANGKDGASPSIGVKTVDGVVYWTVNGELALDGNGNPVPCQTEPAIVPKFKLEEEHWYMSFDDGANWIFVDTGEKTTVVNFRETDSAYIFIVDGEEYPIAKSTEFRLTLETRDIRISSSDAIEIPYVLTGVDETVHFVFTSKFYSAAVDTKKKVIVVTAPGALDPDYLIIKAIRNSDGAYTAQYVKITGYGEIELVADCYEIGSDGGALSIPVNTNLNFDVNFDVDWLTYVETKAVVEKKIIVNVAANTKFVDRIGTMTIKSVAGDVLTVVIKQAMYDDGITMGIKGRPYELASLKDFTDILRSKRISHSDYPVEFVLTQDIDMSGEEWNPLDISAEYPIHFDGQGHTITNFSQLSAQSAAGFFGFLVGTVENLTFDGCSVYAEGQKGGIVASTVGIAGWGHTNYAGCSDHSGSLVNVHVKNSEVTHIAAKNWIGWTAQSGALAGEVYVPGTVIKQCSAENVQVSGDFCCGGLVGQVNYGAVVEECFVKDVTVNVAETVPEKGADNGTWNNRNWIDPYVFNTSGLSLAYAGGIAGIVNDGTIRNCYVSGQSSEINSGSAERQCAGGIAGCIVTKAHIENCWNGAYVAAVSDSPEDNTAHRGGGIVGGASPWVSGENNIKSCINWGDVTGAAGGGVCGYISTPTEGYSPNSYGLNYTSDSYLLTVGFGYPASNYGDPETRVGEIVGDNPHDAGVCFFFHGVKTTDFIGAATQLNWDTNIWNLSGDQPKLKWEN